MENLHNIAFIPAKEHSERLSEKNLCQIGGRSLVRIITEKALAAEVFDMVYLDTESEKIYDEVKDLNIQWIKRDPALADNSYGANELLRNEIAQSKVAENYFMLNCCTPLVRPKTLWKCVNQFNKSSYDSVISLIPFHGYLWHENGPMYDLYTLPNSSDLPRLFLENHVIYGIRRKTFLKFKRRVGENVLHFMMRPIESIDINTEDDLIIARALFENIE